ncbi:MAG: cysteine-rich CWC family protein [Parafilimonas sp.]|nr:cysteine-rich CWC family protein [Parafilimonas sp.]
MPLHEVKTCSRCNNGFECKAGDITHCQCNNIQLSVEERAFIEERYKDCLCANCLLQLKNRYMLFKEKYLFNTK